MKNTLRLKLFDTSSPKDRKTIGNMYRKNPSPYMVWKEGDEAKLEFKGWEYLGIYDQRKLIAVTSIEYVTKSLVTMWGTVVRKDYRDKGFGRKLNELVEKYLKDQDIKKISSHIYVQNLPSIILKLKLGYLIEGTLMDHDFPGQHEYILGKKLY